jgi:hypothetical protein
MTQPVYSDERGVYVHDGNRWVPMTQPVGSAVGQPVPVGKIERILAEQDAWEAGRPARLESMKEALTPRASPLRRLGTAGLRSTEFWLCAFCACVGTLLAFGSPGSLALAGAALLGLATASYAYSRGKVKGRNIVQGKL